MGKKLDAIFGRHFKSSKFKATVSLASSRLAVLKNQRQVRCNQACSDVVQLLQQGHHERALLRVEYVIKDQNLLDAYDMMEAYLNLLVERVRLIEQERACPDELKETISSLLFASSRCGNFPELMEIRTVFASWYGKEFAARAVELRNNCGVNPKMIQKLSTRQPEMESRMKVLKEIASTKNIELQLGEASLTTAEEKLEVSKNQKQDNEEDQSDSVNTRKKYTDVADAAQAAFESAAHAAAAARAAVELSRSNHHDPDNQNSPSNRRTVFEKGEAMKLKPESGNQEIHNENEAAKSKGKMVMELKSASTSSSDSAGGGFQVDMMPLDEHHAKLLEKDIVFDESDDETQDLGVGVKPNKLKGEVLETEKSNKKIPLSIQTGIKVDPRHRYSMPHAAEGSGIQGSTRLNIEKETISVRTRRVQGY